jgi:hypothetical protein
MCAQQCFRIFDAELDFSAAEVAVGLRALQPNPPRRRQRWFEAVRACRRRQPRDWREAPIARIFSSADEVALAQEQAARQHLLAVLRRRRLTPHDFFLRCDDGDGGGDGGVLTADEVRVGVWGQGQG